MGRNFLYNLGTNGARVCGIECMEPTARKWGVSRMLILNTRVPTIQLRDMCELHLSLESSRYSSAAMLFSAAIDYVNCQLTGVMQGHGLPLPKVTTITP